MKRFLIALSLLLPAGCLAESEPDASGSCGAAELGDLIGQPGEVLHGMKFAGPVRIIEFGQPVTMDFNPNRLNISKDPDGVIERVWCG